MAEHNMAKEINSPFTKPYTHSLLGKQMLVDVAASFTAAASISPLITVADRAVVENVSSGRPLLKTMTEHLSCMFKRPQTFFTNRGLYVVWTVYTLTYLTANLSETLIDNFFNINKTATATYVSSAVFVVNTPLSVWKDVRFAQFFGRRSGVGPGSGTGSVTACLNVPRKMPFSVSSAFLARDFITVFGSFFLGSYVSSAVPDRLAESEQAKASVAQLVVPGMTQLLATPLHLLALNIYNQPDASGLASRLAATRQSYIPVTTMRAARLVPAYGVGIILNNTLRRSCFGTRNERQQTDAGV